MRSSGISGAADAAAAGTIVNTSVDEPHGVPPGVTVDTLSRVQTACAAAGIASWRELVAATQRGIVFNVTFAERRPTQFVREFSTLVRASGLKFRADNALDLFLGAPAALERMIDRGMKTRLIALAAFGDVAQDESKGVEVSGACRSAGISHQRRKSRGFLPVSG